MYGRWVVGWYCLEDTVFATGLGIFGILPVVALITTGTCDSPEN